MSRLRQQASSVLTRSVFPTVIAATSGDPSITISTAAIDREGDVLDPAGAILSAYQRNPVVLWAHDHSQLPVGSCTSIAVTPDGLRATWKWLEGDDFAAKVKNAFVQRVLGAASVGFIPVEYEELAAGGYKYTKWELIEWSLCPVPANPEAVRRLKSLGLSVGASNRTPILIDGSPILPGKRKGAAPDVAPEAYSQMGSMVAQAGTSFSTVVDSVQSLLAPAMPGGRGADDDQTHLSAIVEHCAAVSDALLSVAALAAPMLRGGAPKATVAQALHKVSRAVALLRAVKAGARHSAADQKLLQGAHDQLVALGATCTPADDGKRLRSRRPTDKIVVDDAEIDISEAELKEIIARVISDQVEQLTGRVR